MVVPGPGSSGIAGRVSGSQFKRLKCSEPFFQIGKLLLVGLRLVSGTDTP